MTTGCADSEQLVQSGCFRVREKTGELKNSSLSTGFPGSLQWGRLSWIRLLSCDNGPCLRSRREPLAFYVLSCFLSDLPLAHASSGTRFTRQQLSGRVNEDTDSFNDERQLDRLWSQEQTCGPGRAEADTKVLCSPKSDLSHHQKEEFCL